MFSFASTAKPGKHFLLETDDEDGQLENGSVQAGSVANENDKNRSAKGNDYAGEFLFLQNLFCLSFFSKFTGNRRSAKKGKSGKNLRVRDFAKFCCNILYFHPNLFQFCRQI